MGDIRGVLGAQVSCVVALPGLCGLAAAALEFWSRQVQKTGGDPLVMSEAHGAALAMAVMMLVVWAALGLDARQLARAGRPRKVWRRVEVYSAPKQTRAATRAQAAAVEERRRTVARHDSWS